MIKKLLLFSALVAFFGSTNLNAQCTPGPQTAGGIYPDSAQGLPNGYVGTPYSTTMTVVVPADTNVGFSIPIDSLVLTTFTGFPPAGGFTYVCSSNHCSFKGGTKGCILISGSPTVADTGTWDLSAMVDAYIGGSHTGIPESVNYYKIKILNSTAGIENLDMTKFDVGQNVPNPFDQQTKIIYTTPTSSTMILSVYNVLGKLMFETTFKSEKGYNSHQLSANNFPSGIYMYSLSNGKTSITKRMIIAGK